jgi:basic amino acid/polyamine antiporter, APA family
VTIGAGIYVLIGAAAARAGMQAPLAFVVAAGLMALSGAAFAEPACRFPVAAGEAAYAREAFRPDRLTTIVGPLHRGAGVREADWGIAGHDGAYRA